MTRALPLPPPLLLLPGGRCLLSPASACSENFWACRDDRHRATVVLEYMWVVLVLLTQHIATASAAAGWRSLVATT
eukprot:COSAG01_NODE_7260_length_3279_cov_1.910377_3_plen_76_part_00